MGIFCYNIWMKKYSLLYTALGLIAILAFLHLIALEFYFYWTLWWYDIMMHTLAGLSGGLAALWFLNTTNSVRALLLALLSVMIFGITYEVFEYIYDIISPGSYWQDTILDLICDGLGAILASMYVMSGQIREYFSGSQGN